MDKDKIKIKELEIKIALMAQRIRLLEENASLWRCLYEKEMARADSQQAAA